MDNRLYCKECDAIYSAGTWSCAECCGFLAPFDPAPVRFAVGTGAVPFTPSLTEPVFEIGFLSRRQAG